MELLETKLNINNGLNIHDLPNVKFESPVKDDVQTEMQANEEMKSSVQRESSLSSIQPAMKSQFNVHFSQNF